MPLESVNSLRMSQIMPAMNLAKLLESRRTSNNNNHPPPLIVLSSNLKGNHYGGIGGGGSVSTTHVSSANRRYQKQSIHTTTGEIMVTRPGPSSYVSARGGNITNRVGRVGDSTRSASHSVQSRRMKSSQLIKEGRLEEAMQEVNTMLIVTNIAPKTARDDVSQETRPATPTAQSEAFYLRG